MGGDGRSTIAVAMILSPVQRDICAARCRGALPWRLELNPAMIVIARPSPPGSPRRASPAGRAGRARGPRRRSGATPKLRAATSRSRSDPGGTSRRRRPGPAAVADHPAHRRRRGSPSAAWTGCSPAAPGRPAGWPPIMSSGPWVAATPVSIGLAGTTTKYLAAVSAPMRRSSSRSSSELAVSLAITSTRRGFSAGGDPLRFWAAIDEPLVGEVQHQHHRPRQQAQDQLRPDVLLQAHLHQDRHNRHRGQDRQHREQPHLHPQFRVGRAVAQHDLRDADQQVDEQDDRAAGVEQEREDRVRRDRRGDDTQKADDRGRQNRGGGHSSTGHPTSCGGASRRAASTNSMREAVYIPELRQLSTAVNTTAFMMWSA